MTNHQGSPKQPRSLPRAEQTEERPVVRPAAEPAALWTIEEVAAYLQLPVSSVYRMTARKARVRIPHVRLGSSLRFRRGDIDQWLELLTVSNLAVLRKLRQKVQQVTHGQDSQKEAAFR